MLTSKLAGVAASIYLPIKEVGHRLVMETHLALPADSQAVAADRTVVAEIVSARRAAAPIPFIADQVTEFAALAALPVLQLHVGVVQVQNS